MASETLDQPISSILGVFFQSNSINSDDELDVPNEIGDENVDSDEE